MPGVIYWGLRRETRGLFSRLASLQVPRRVSLVDGQLCSVGPRHWYSFNDG